MVRCGFAYYPLGSMGRWFSSDSWLAEAKQPLGALLGGLVVFAVSGIVCTVLYLLGTRALADEVRDGLVRVAKAAATRINPEEHRMLTSPEHMLLPEYTNAVAKLREIRDSDSQMAYIYTCVLIDGRVHFILDAAEPGDNNGDGIEDKSNLLDPYDEASKELLAAFEKREATADTKPYKDRWGTFVSGYAPVFDGKGNLICVLGVDLTAEDFAARLEGMRVAWHWSLVLSFLLAMLVAAVIFVTNRRLAAVHRAQQQTYEIIAAQNEILQKVVQNDPLDHTLRSISEIAASHAPGTEWTIHAKEATPGYPGAILRTPIHDNDGNVIGWLVVTGVIDHSSRELLSTLERMVVQLSGMAIVRAKADIELASARDKALEASRLKSAFLASMSHEIRTPMNGIIGMSEVLMSTHLDERQRDCLNTIRESADVLVGMINDILDHSKLEANALRIEETEFNVRDLIEGVASLLAPQAQKKGLELVCSISPRIENLLRTDSLRLRQILLNLIGNAIKFTESGEVWVEAKVDCSPVGGAVLELGIHDTGIGIASDRIDAIFESFSQADISTTRRFGGTGLGLTISKQLVERMGGSINVASEIGQGSSFFVRIPVELGIPIQINPFFQHEADCKVNVIWRNAQGRHSIKHYCESLGFDVRDGAMPSELPQAGEPNGIWIVDEGSLADFKSAGFGAESKTIVLKSMAAQTSTEDDETFRFLWKPVRYDDLRRLLSDICKREEAILGDVFSNIEFDSLHVLVADDNKTNRRVAGHMIERMGHTVAFASNGEEAVEAALSTEFDAIFMDIEMPIMDGFEATRRIRNALQNGSAIPIFAMTAHDLALEGNRIESVGFAGAILKPIRGERLAEVLTNISYRKSRRSPPAA